MRAMLLELSMDEMKRAFESWARAGGMDLHHGDFSGYMYPATGLAWASWQAACEWQKTALYRMQ